MKTVGERFLVSRRPVGWVDLGRLWARENGVERETVLRVLGYGVRERRGSRRVGILLGSGLKKRGSRERVGERESENAGEEERDEGFKLNRSS